MTKRLEAILGLTQKGLKILERAIYLNILDRIIGSVSTEDDKIILSPKNIAAINILGRDKEVNSKLGTFFKAVINGILSLFDDSVEGMGRFNRDAVKMAEPTKEKLKNHSAMALNSVFSLEQVYSEVKQKSLALMSRPGGISLKELKAELEDVIVNKEIASKYYSRWVYDIYSQYERVASNEVRKGLGLKWAIYQGGLIDTSRDFCEERNGNVYSEEEIMSWANLEWNGKPETGYDPLTDAGGYNCRHRYDWISYQLAKRLRPGI